MSNYMTAATSLAMAVACFSSNAAAYDCAVMTGAADKYIEVCQAFDSACDADNRHGACRLVRNAESLTADNQVVYWMMMQPIVQQSCPPGRAECDAPLYYQLMAQ